MTPFDGINRVTFNGRRLDVSLSALQLPCMYDYEATDGVGHG